MNPFDSFESFQEGTRASSGLAEAKGRAQTNGNNQLDARQQKTWTDWVLFCCCPHR